ncbi:MAG: cupin domain-containing protein [Acidimicrobiaceae bacterium]|nr:cupin domain-containing protein [Acidimicrobiaceae bacterium]
MAAMESVRPVDHDGLANAGPDERWTQILHDRHQGAVGVDLRLIRTPGGSGSPAGLHVHDFEQVFYLLEGEMNIEVDGVESVVRAPSAIVFPQGVPHRNWNAGSVSTLHLAINAPAPDPDQPISRPA